MLLKSHWVWRNIRGTTQIIKKKTDFWKNFLNSSQCQECIGKGSWVSWTLVTRLKNYNLSYFKVFLRLAWCRWTLRIINIMADLWEIVLRFIQCLKCIDKISWVFFALVTWFRNYNIIYFWSFTEIDLMSEERPELSRKWRISGKSF